MFGHKPVQLHIWFLWKSMPGIYYLSIYKICSILIVLITIIVILVFAHKEDLVHLPVLVPAKMAILGTIVKFQLLKQVVLVILHHAPLQQPFAMLVFNMAKMYQAAQMFARLAKPLHILL